MIEMMQMICDVTHRIGLQDCKIVLRAIFKKDRVLGILLCFCKCVFFHFVVQFCWMIADG